MSDTPEDAWFFSKDGRQYGPVAWEELKFVATNGQLHPRQDLAWKSGMPEWVMAGEIEGLFETVAEPEPGPAAAPAAEAMPDIRTAGREESASELLVQESNWVGVGRATWLIGSLVIGAVAGVLPEYAGEWLIRQAEGRTEVVDAIPILAGVASIVLCVKRLRNTGTSGWWILGNFVPILNLWVGYRMFACPPGYAFHRKMDGPGIFLAILYWLFVAAVVLSLAALVLVFLGKAGDAELQKQIQDAWREIRNAAESATQPAAN